MQTKTNSKLVFIIIAIILAIQLMTTFVKAETLTPDDNQYLELRATTITDTGENGKQVIMELWAYNLEFKRFRCKIFI